PSPRAARLASSLPPGLPPGRSHRQGLRNGHFPIEFLRPFLQLAERERGVFRHPAHRSLRHALLPYRRPSLCARGRACRTKRLPSSSSTKIPCRSSPCWEAPQTSSLLSAIRRG